MRIRNEIWVRIGFIQRKENVWVPQWKNAVVSFCWTYFAEHTKNLSNGRYVLTQIVPGFGIFYFFLHFDALFAG
jgi:hypothetical protein